MVIGQKYLLKEDHHTVTVHPGNKWKPVESLKVQSLREEPAEEKWEEEMLLGRQAEMMVLKRKLCF
jgi:hypothetical protein